MNRLIQNVNFEECCERFSLHFKLCFLFLSCQFVVLDEASQMTEPASLLPIARFGCEKLVLVGDPKVCYEKLVLGGDPKLCIERFKVIHM